MLVAALIGFALGWLGSIPIAGPIAALVITRSLQARYRAAAWIAVGSGLSEAAYAFLAFWGFATFLTDYPVIEIASRAVGALVLAGLGLMFLLKRPPEEKDVGAPRDKSWGNFLLGFTICAFNPTLLATWGAVVTILYSSDAVAVTQAQALPFALGCGAGIVAWFLLLVWLVRRYRERFKKETLHKAVRVIGVLLLLLAAWMGYRFVEQLLA